MEYMDYDALDRLVDPATAASNVDLWPDVRWSGSDLRSVLSELEEFGEVSGQVSSQIRGIGVEIVIAFATGAIAGGFLNKLGSDLHDAARDRLKHLLLRRGKLQAENEEGLLQIRYPRVGNDATKVAYHLQYRNAADLETFLRRLWFIDQMLRRARSANRPPSRAGHAYTVDVTLEDVEQQCWSLTISENLATESRGVKERKVLHLQFETGREPQD